MSILQARMAPAFLGYRHKTLGTPMSAILLNLVLILLLQVGLLGVKGMQRD